MRWVRLMFRIFGWLLTPFLAWAASLFGAVVGLIFALRMHDPFVGVGVALGCGAVAGFASILLWLRVLRRSPEIREVLAVTEDGTPDTTAFTPIVDPDESPDANKTSPGAEARAG
jgi:hypothetical protein